MTGLAEQVELWLRLENLRADWLDGAPSSSTCAAYYGLVHISDVWSLVVEVVSFDGCRPTHVALVSHSAVKSSLLRYTAAEARELADYFTEAAAGAVNSTSVLAGHLAAAADLVDPTTYAPEIGASS